VGGVVDAGYSLARGSGCPVEERVGLIIAYIPEDQSPIRTLEQELGINDQRLTKIRRYNWSFHRCLWPSYFVQMYEENSNGLVVSQRYQVVSTVIVDRCNPWLAKGNTAVCNVIEDNSSNGQTSYANAWDQVSVVL
jgi:hypothetical protein